MRLGLSMVRTHFWGLIFSRVFTSMSHLLPLKKLHETSNLLAFSHPKPNYPFHVLLVPKRQLRGIGDLSLDDVDFMTDLFQAVQILVERYDLEQYGYRLINNGGKYQDVPHLHFHLISHLDQGINFETAS
jgi:histidine triad (HIT) family protein